MNIDYFRRAVASVDDHRVHPARLDIRQRALKVGPVQGATGDATIVIGIWDELPTVVDLAFDIGLACLPLGMERIELQIEVMFGGLASVDGAAADFDLVHAAVSRSPPSPLAGASLRPKNLGPFQFVPVMILAMADRLE